MRASSVRPTHGDSKARVPRYCLTMTPCPTLWIYNIPLFITSIYRLYSDFISSQKIVTS